MLVREGREGDGGETPGLQPVNCRRVDGNGFLRGGVGTVLKVPGVINITHHMNTISKHFLVFAKTHLYQKSKG